MLSSLLPGLRELRAPLAAGFVWMVAVWFLLEPHWDRADHNDGFVASANRLIATLNVLGQAVVLSFVAFLLGSFSVFMFTRILLARLHPSLRPSGRVLEGLSEEGRASLWQVAYDSRDRIEEELTLSGVPVDDVLRARLDSDEAGANRLHPGARAESHEEPALRVEQEAQAEVIASGVLRNLAVVANTQLLGKEPDVFAAVDRNKAEVEFRVALVPALVGLALAIGVTLWAESWWAALLALLLGLLGAVGLLLDAARGRRDANEMLLSLMEHGRLTPPSVLRLESEARARADRSPGKVVKRASDDFERATRGYLQALNRVPSSGTIEQVQMAHDAARIARAKAENLDRSLQTHAVSPLPEPSAVASLDALDQVLAQWTAYNAGVAERVEEPAVDWAGVEQSTVEEMQHQIREGRRAVLQVQDHVRPIIADIANRVAAHSAPEESTTGPAMVRGKETPGAQSTSESGTRG